MWKAVFAAVLFVAAPVARAEPVDLELVLAVDVSGSVDADEAILQRDGYASAFRHPAVLRAITMGRHKKIAVTYVEWAGDHYQARMIDWTLIDGKKSADDFAEALEWAPLATNVWTSISGAINYASTLFAKNDYDSKRRVVDISGDGPNNDGEYVVDARDRAIAQGLTINGLPIINGKPSPFGRPQMADLDLYYIDCVIGGPRAFIVVANGFEDFARAIRRKLILEIADLVPPPFDRRRSGGFVRVQAEDRPPCDIGEKMLPGFLDY